MEVPSFSPKIRLTTDALGATFMAGARGLLLVALVLLPFAFIPGLLAVSGTTKSFLLLGLLVPTVILASLGYLRLGVVTWRFLPLLLAWWGVVAAAAVSGLLAPQLRVAFMGDALEPQTVGFLALGGVFLVLSQLLLNSRKVVLSVYAGLLAVTGLIALLQLVRIFLPQFPFITALIPDTTSSLVGGFNDLALLSTFTIMVSLVALVQLRLTRVMQAVVAGVVTLLTLLVAIVNFYAMWVILAFFSLLLLLFALTKGRFAPVGNAPSLIVVGVVGIVFLIASIAVVGGSAFGGLVSQLTGITYIEVRPSAAATLDIMRQVYADNALLGAGPNHFIEAWTSFKDRSLNATLFWNTTFFSGSGFIPTWFITGGILSILAWSVFFGTFLWTGFRALFRPASTDELWYFIATISFLGGAFVWGASLFYVTGAVVLLLGLLATAFLILAESKLTQRRGVELNLLAKPRTSIALIVVVMVLIIGSVASGYYGFRQLLGLRTYATAMTAPITNITDQTVPAGLASAYALAPNATYARDLARYQLSILNLMAQKENPTDEDVARFQQLMAESVQAATIAVDTRRTDVRNWQTLADVYGTLAALGIEGAEERVTEVIPELKSRDPHNPQYALTEAMVRLRSEDEAGARTKIAEALALKSNYTDALNLLTQLDVATGNIKEAITTTRSLVALEANNPGRYYQLGVLYVADNNSAAAVEAFTAALSLNPQYANARYLRAIELAKQGNKDAALADMAIVRETNTDNAALADMVGKIERGESLEVVNPGTVTEPTTATDGEATTTTTEPDTDLIAPVNTVPNASSTSATN